MKYEKGKLIIQYDESLRDPKYLPDYLSLADTLVEHSPYAKEYASLVTAHSVELFMDRLKAKDYETSEQIFYRYVNHLMPKLTSDKQSEDVTYNISVFASQGLVLSSLISDEKISDTVFDKLMGPNFKISTQDNPTFMYNLACYYSLHKQKNMLLEAMRQSIKLGKSLKEFTTDSDFQEYWSDADFNQLLQEGQ